MGDGRDEMIEIGDPAIEPTVPEPTHQVVIQYRDRGIPWMLLPALLMLSAIATIYAYRKLQPTIYRPSPTVAVAVPVEPEVVPVVEPKVVIPAVEPAPTPVDPPAAAPVEPSPPPVEPTPTPAPVEPAPMSSPDEPKPAPRVQGLGFDPNAFLPDPRATDPSVSTTSQDPVRVEPAPPGVADPNTLPVEVDPDDLPPDPRKAKEMRSLRAAESRKRAESERTRFHSELRAILKKSAGQRGQAIIDLCEQYGDDVDPSAKNAAVKQLNGSYAGVSRSVRIGLLRSLGYPEAAIFKDLLHNLTKDDPQISRSSWRTAEDALVYAASLLLSNPPVRPSIVSTPVSVPKPRASATTRSPGSLLLRDNPGR